MSMAPRFSGLPSSRRALPLKRAFSHGHLPSKRLGVAATSASLEELLQALNEAVKDEDYAEAARMRDEIMRHPEQQAVLQRQNLQAQLEEALQQQDYKAAAELRDRLAQLPQPHTAPAKPVSHKSEATTSGVRVTAVSAYVRERSKPERGQYFYVYRICIENRSDRIVHLRNRRWDIVDATGHPEEVRGPGVVGQQPVLLPGKKFEYMSACPLRTESGYMQGEYECIVLDEEGEWGETLMVKIAPFLLTTRAVGSLGA